VRVPVTGTRAAAEWRVKLLGAGKPWSVQGLYVVEDGRPTVQLSDATDTSVYEYAWMVGVADAPTGSFDFVGMGHGHETRTGVTMTLDGVANGTGPGQRWVVQQTMDTRLPLTAGGTVDDVTVLGSSTVRHTFSANGLLVEHGHVMNAGYQGKTDYGAMCPSGVGLNRFQVQDGPVRTPTGSGATIDLGVQASRYAVWATTHPYRLTLTLPSGGPDTKGDWSHAGPDYAFFLDGADYGKLYVCYVGSTYANRINTGTTSHAQRYTVTAP